MNRLTKSSFLILTLCMLFCIQASSQQLAFPEAEGAGRFTTGGRGSVSSPTTVFEVTNLGDNNTAGSLRFACSQSASTYPNRTIVFKISGTIHLASKLSIPKNTTIAGQTAPGEGICIADYPVVISGDNVIIRYLKIRMGDKNQNKGMVDGSGGDDALGALEHSNIIVDHCSISWSADEALTIYRGDNLTLQWNIISEPLNYSYHFETGDSDYESHGYGGIWGARNGSFHHNLIAHCKNRTPRFAGASTYDTPVQGVEKCDFRNNVIYDWGINNIYGGEGGYYNLVNNYYKYGPSTTSRKFQVVAPDSSTTLPYAQYYLKGNYVDGSVANTNNNWLSVTMKSGHLADTVRSKVNTPFSLPVISSETTALQAYTDVLNSAGAILPKRDTLDERIINDVKNRTGRIIDVQGGFPHGTAYASTVNAWPTLANATAPTDTDHDGMPDVWEISKSLNPNDASDRNTYNAQGYTMLEEYLNTIIASIPATTSSSSGTATWALIANQDAVVTGNINAAVQTMDANMVVNNYNQFPAGTANDANFVAYTAQRIKPTAGWPGSQSTVTANQWVEYSIAPSANSYLKIQSVAMDFGPAGSTNTMKADVIYSIDNFATTGTKLNGSTPITLPAIASGDNSFITSTFNNLDITVPTGAAFKVRVYPWWPSTASTSKYLVEKNVVISATSFTVLPLNLLSFDGEIAKGLKDVVNLKWLTAAEKNVLKFEIERRNGTEFSKIGEVPARNVNSASYSWTDNYPISGNNYYRLKMIDNDGTFTYSKMITAKVVNTKKALFIYPNPVDKLLTISHPEEVATISIIDASGKRLAKQKVSLNEISTAIDVSALTAGYYLIEYKSTTNQLIEKFIKL